MSLPNVQRVIPFIKLLLETEKQQKLALLNSMTSAQLTFMNEFFYNLITVPVTEKDKKKLARYVAFIKLAGKKNIKHATLKSLLKRRRVVVLKILDIVRHYLDQMADELYSGNMQTTFSL